jgi:tripartite-type tricarboxylate transporter receptor subunit TctC
MKARVAAAIAFGCACLGADAGFAQSYPAKPIHIVVASAPGGVTDLLGRSLAVELGRAWAQQVVIENRPGANSQIGAEYVAKSAPDGYTLLLAPETAFVVNPSLYAKLPYDADKDFTPVAGLAMVQQALVVHPSLPVNTVAELIALAKAKPGELNYGCAGIGSASHLNMELFKLLTEAKLVGVHYRGATPALTDVIAGHVSAMFVNIGSVLEPWKAGRVRLLAIGTADRLSEFTDLPTVAESGVRFRSKVLVRPVCAERHPARHRRQAQRRDPAHLHGCRVPREGTASQRAATDRRLGRAICGADQARRRQVEQRDPCREHQAGLTGAVSRIRLKQLVLLVHQREAAPAGCDRLDDGRTVCDLIAGECQRWIVEYAEIAVIFRSTPLELRDPESAARQQPEVRVGRLRCQADGLNVPHDAPVEVAMVLERIRGELLGQGRDKGHGAARFVEVVAAVGLVIEHELRHVMLRIIAEIELQMPWGSFAPVRYAIAIVDVPAALVPNRTEQRVIVAADLQLAPR